MDPREVLMEMDLDDLSATGESHRNGRKARHDGDDDSSDLLNQLKRLRWTVEEDHDARLRGIEINVRWLMVLVGGEVLAIIGFAIGSMAGATP